MFVYFHGTKDAYNTVQTFHKAEKAAEYVIAQIESYIGGKPTLGKKSPYKKKSALHAQQPAIQFQQIAVNVAQPVALGFGDDMADQMPAQPPVNIAMPAAAWAVNQPFPTPTSTKSKTEDKSDELDALIAHMVLAKKNKTFDNATRAIELYEMYAKYVLNSEAALHTLQEIKVEQ